MLLIGGIDYGTNFSISLINLNGEIIYLDSGKDLKENILNICTKYGKIIAISIDKKGSKKVKKLAASLNAEIILPNKDMSKIKKYKLIEKFKNKKLNSHEKSSLAAAIFAYKKIKQRLKKLEDKLGALPLYVKEEYILHRMKICQIKNYYAEGRIFKFF